MIQQFYKTNPLAFYAIAYGASAAFQKGLGFILFMWLAHSLQVHAYATFGLLYALQSGLATLAVAGVIEAVIGLLKDCRSEESRTRLFNSANSVLGILVLAAATIVWLGSGLLTQHLNASTFEISLVVLSGVLTAFFTLQSVLTRLNEDHFSSLILTFFPPLIGLAGGYIGYIYTGTVIGFFGGFAIGMVASLLLFGLLGFGSYALIQRPHDVLPILKRILPFAVIAVLGWLNGYGNTYLVQSFFTATDVARFTFAYTLSSILQLVATSLNQVWSPRVFKMVHDLHFVEAEIKNRRFYKFQGLALGVVGAGILILAPLIIQTIGESLIPYRGLTNELFFLFAAYALSIPWYHVQNYYYAYSKGKQMMNMTMMTSLLGLALWLLCAQVFGVIGIYIGFMMMMVVRMLGALYWARREWAVGVLWEGPLIALIFLTIGTWVSHLISRQFN